MKGLILCSQIWIFWFEPWADPYSFKCALWCLSLILRSLEFLFPSNFTSGVLLRPLKQGCSPEQNLLNSQTTLSSSVPKDLNTTANSFFYFFKYIKVLKNDGTMKYLPSPKSVAFIFLSNFFLSNSAFSFGSSSSDSSPWSSFSFFYSFSDSSMVNPPSSVIPSSSFAPLGKVKVLRILSY